MDSNNTIGLIGGKSGDALTDELHNKGYKVALVGGRENEHGMDKADFILVTDLNNHDKIISFLKEKKVKYIVIGTGHFKAINLVEILEENGFVTSIDHKKSILAKDKVLFKQRLEEIGIATPKFLSFKGEYNIELIKETIGIPCVVKSATDAVQPTKANSCEELRACILDIDKTNTEVLVEQYINGNDCTVAVVSDGINIRSLGVTYWSKAKENNLKGFENAYSQKMHTDMEKKLVSIAEKIVRELKYIGVMRVDFIVDENIYVLELNSVIVTSYVGTVYPFFKEQGINIAELMVNNALSIFTNKINRVIEL